MYIYIHLVQYSSGIDAKFIAGTEQLSNVFVTACARAATPSLHNGCKPSGTIMLHRPCLGSVSSSHLQY